MDLIEKIKNDEILQHCIKDICEENGVCMNIHSEITNFVIIDVDKYYANLRQAYTPATPDCLIVYECTTDIYGLAVVELKKAKHNKGLKFNSLKEKFETCLSDFMTDKFKHYFDRDFKTVKLFLVTNLKIGERKEIAGIIDILLSTRFSFRDKKYLIDIKNNLLEPCF